MNSRHLTELRRELRFVDSELISILARRIRLVKKIGLLKQKLKMDIIDVHAEKSAQDNFAATAARAGVEEGYARRVAELIIEGSVAVQTRERPPATSSDALLKQFSETMLRAEKEGRKLIRLDIGEPRFRTPSAISRGAGRYLSRRPTILYGSSYGMAELTEAIAERLNHQHGTRLRPSNVLIVPGGRFGIFVAMRACISSLERVVVPEPAWPAYDSFINLIGARKCSVPTSLDERWDIDLTALEEELRRRPKMLVLNNPSNPTGKVLSRKRFREVIDLARKHRTTVLSDEVYTSFCNKPVPSILEYPDSGAIYINSFSKEFSMTGWRIGYAVADEQTITKMRLFLQTTLTNVPEFVQAAALVALKDRSEDAPRARLRILRRVEMACEELKRAGFDLYPPEGAFYVFPRLRVTGIDSIKFAQHLVAEHGVGVLPGSIFGGYRDFLRLAITESDTAVKTGIRRIAKAMDEWSPE